MGAARRIDVHQDRPGPRAGHVDGQPLPAVHRPHADAVLRFDAKFGEPMRKAIRGVQQLGPREPFGLMTGDDGQTVRPAPRDVLQLLSDGTVKQRYGGSL